MRRCVRDGRSTHPGDGAAPPAPARGRGCRGAASRRSSGRFAGCMTSGGSMPMQSQADVSTVSPRWAPIAAIVLVAVVFFLPARADYLKPVLPMEEGSVLVYPELVLKGEIPN